MATPPPRKSIDAAYRALHERMRARARWYRARYAYRGSMQSVDLAHEALRRLSSSPKYAAQLRQEPASLLNLAGLVVRHVLFDRFRRDRRRPPLERRSVGEDLPAPSQGEAEDWQWAWIEGELGRLERGEVPIAFRRPAEMVRAWRMRREGWTDAAIAEQMGISKALVNTWINAVTAHLGVRARREGLVHDR